MSSIRVTYSGLISFLVGGGTIFTGLIFTLIITRELSQTEFGTWAVIGTLTVYALLLRPVISFWNTREIARGNESGKTAVMSSGFLAMLGFFIYLVIIYFYSQGVDIDQNILLVASILVPIEFFRGVLVGIANGYKPQVEEYGLVTFEVLKIIFALSLIYALDLGLFGLIIALFCSTLSNVLILVFNLRKKLRGSFQKNYVKKWLKLSWVPLFPNISMLVQISEITAFTLITGGVTGVAYWASAWTVSRIVNHSNKMAKAVYPKIVYSGKKEIFENNITHVFYFAFPLAALSLVFAKPGLFALNPIYQIAFPIVFFMVPVVFLRTFTEMFGNVLQSLEKVDVKEDINFKEYIKSKFVIIPTLRIIHRFSSLGIVIVALLILVNSSLSELDLVLYWAIVVLATQIPYSAFIFYLVRKEVSPKFETKIILKYFLASIIIFGINYYLIDEFLIYEESIFIFLPNLFPFLAFGIFGYLGLTYGIDKKTRGLVQSIVKEVIKKKR